MDDLKGKTALITGASSGLGAAFARQLAARGATVVLVARRLDRLQALAAELSGRYGVVALPLVCDLASPDGAETLVRDLEGRHLDIVINNAGAGVHQAFSDTEWRAVEAQIQLNVTSLVRLTHRFAGLMRARGRGHILNVASVGAYLPVPGYAAYAAAKVFVRNFSEALAHELAPSGVRVACLCPGGIDTEFFAVAGQPVTAWMKPALMSPERCARIGLGALFGCRHTVVSGLGNKLGMFLTRFLPRWLLALVAGKVMRRPAQLPPAAH